MKFENPSLENSAGSVVEKPTLFEKIKTRGKNLALALLVTGSSMIAEEAFATDKKETIPDSNSQEQIDESQLEKQTIMQIADALSNKYPVIIEYVMMIPKGYKLSEEVGLDRNLHTLNINYKDQQTGKMQQYLAQVSGNASAEYILTTMVERLIHQDQEFDEINAEKISSTPEVQSYFDKYGFSLKGNGLYIDNGKYSKDIPFISFIDVESVSFIVNGDILSIMAVNSNGSMQIVRFNKGMFID